VPTVVSVTSTKPDGKLHRGRVIPVTVNFSKLVTSTGSVTVTLETGTGRSFLHLHGRERLVGHLSATSSKQGTPAPILDVLSIAGTVKDAGNVAITDFTPATSLAATSDLVIDTTAPTIVSVSSSHADGLRSRSRLGEGHATGMDFAHSKAAVSVAGRDADDGRSRRVDDEVAGGGEAGGGGEIGNRDVAASLTVPAMESTSRSALVSPAWTT